MTTTVAPGEYLTYYLKKDASIEDAIALAVGQYREATGEMPHVAKINIRHRGDGIDLSDIGLYNIHCQPNVQPGTIMLGPE
jgi:hypothetical protein